MLIDVSLLQFLNAFFPIFVTDFGITIDLSSEQPENALSPISVTESGKIIDVNPLQFSKTLGFSEWQFIFIIT